VIAIVDYGLGNLASVRNAFAAVGGNAVVTHDAGAIQSAAGVVLPGVGAASTGMRRLRERNLDSAVKDVADSGGAILGLCLGMQLLFDRSEEGDAECLGLIPGTVRLLRGQEKVPHIGWNQVASREAFMWRGIDPDPYFYFVHSYVCEPGDPDVVVGTTEYGQSFCSVVARDMVWGTQFHPERSGPVGLRLIRNFVDLCDMGQESMMRHA